jgi:aspartyl-tRNA(Asn)/glutamyl-tRNA(Gln) amidotransferase subunit A
VNKENPMSDPALHYLTIQQAAERLASGELSPVQLVEASLARIASLDPTLHAFITLTADSARREARQAEQEIRAGRYRGPLHGIPIAHKDVLWTQGVRTTAHSRLLEDWVPRENAAAVERLQAAGAISLGKTACHEFAFGSPADDDAFPAARNPWNPDHMPGSSSSGSGAAVAAGLCMAATGTDTGGSIRHPAAACGIVGMKPTYGLVSLYGVIPLAPSMDHVGPMTRTVADNALLLQALGGHDPRDRSSADRPVTDFLGSIGQPIRGMRVGVPRRFIDVQPHASEVLQAFAEAQRVFQTLGAELVDIDPPGIEHAFDIGSLIIAYEAHRYHADNLQRAPEKFGSALRLRLERGAKYSQAEYESALAGARALCTTSASLFASTVDVVISPGREMPAETMAQLISNPTGKRSVTNRVYSVTGSPAITLPMGFSAEGLPLALQIAADHFCEVRLYQVAAAYESAAGWSECHPC